MSALLDRYDEQAGLVRGTITHRPTHSRLPDGTPAHFLIESLDLALLLLQHRGEDAGALAIVDQTLRTVLRLEGKDPTTVAYGLWPWVNEEPLHAMVRMDGNWSEFIGARLAHLLAHHRQSLAEDLVEATTDAMADAALAVFRRNVGAYYTNICIMGALPTLAAGEMLGDPRMLAYGRRRLERAVEHFEYHGNFNEYNSPNYMPVTMWELERLISIIQDTQAREHAMRLLTECWRSIARHLHLPTGQLAGPWSRTYADHLLPAFARYIETQTGLRLAPHPGVVDQDGLRTLWATVEHLPCPDALVDAMRQPEARREERFSCVRREVHEHIIEGVVRHHDDACMGSVNQGSLWEQRRNILAFWRSEADPAAMARIRLLMDDADIASGYLMTHQRGMHVLCGVEAHTDLGIAHLFFDHPKDDVFGFNDLRLRVELRAADAAVSELVSGGVKQWALTSTPWRCVVTPAQSLAGLGPVRWESFSAEGIACVDGVVYSGQPIAVKLDALTDLRLAVGLTVQRCDQTPPEGTMHWEEVDVSSPSDGGNASDHAGTRKVTATWSPSTDVVLSTTMATEPVPTGYHLMGEPNLPVPEPIYRTMAAMRPRPYQVPS